jgi:hypothetical protein
MGNRANVSISRVGHWYRGNEICLSLCVGGTVNRLTSAPVNMKEFDVLCLSQPATCETREGVSFFSFGFRFCFTSFVICGERKG